ncbi:MAG: SPFH domain-containing protein [Thermoflexus sp.]
MAMVLILLLSIFGVALSALLLRSLWVAVPELRAAVLWNRWHQGLGRVLVGPGIYAILPGVERIWGWLDLQPRVLSGVTREIVSADGMPLEIDWQVIYRIDPFRILPENRSVILHALTKDAGSMVRIWMEESLRARVGSQVVGDLITGGLQRLAGRVHADLSRRMATRGIEISAVMLRAIRPPLDYQRALIQARAFDVLREALRQFTDQDLQRVMDLERVRILGAEEGLLILPLPGATDTMSSEQRAA